jgi:hexosaminidase
MTSWSTSGQYSPVFESEEEMTEEYAIRHVYPLNGFNMLIAAYAEAIKSAALLDIDAFIKRYCAERYGFGPAESETFWRALKTAPFEVAHGKVGSPEPMTVKLLLDSSTSAMDHLYGLHPQKNKEEFEHYKVMAEIRTNYLSFHYLLGKVNSPSFSQSELPGVLKELEHLKMGQDIVDMHFAELNKNFLYPAEIKEENEVRDVRVKLLYDRLSRAK